MDQRVTVRRLDARQRARAADRADVITALAQGPEHPDGAGRGVEPHRVADPGMLGRISRQHDRHPPL